MTVFFGVESSVQRSHVTIENPKTIGEHLKRRRQELRLRQKDVALIFGVTEKCLCLWEQNKSNMHSAYYSKAISFLGYNLFPMDTTTLSGRMKAYRITHGLTQEDLADMLGVNENTVFHWEKGDSIPAPGRLKQLENILRKELS